MQACGFKRKMKHMGTFKGHDTLCWHSSRKVLPRGTLGTLNSFSFNVANSGIKTNVLHRVREPGWKQLTQANPPPDNACRHSHTLFIAIPGIFRPPSLLLRVEAGHWLRAGASTLWPMWNSSTRIGLACTQQQAQTHTDPHRTQHRQWRELFSGYDLLKNNISVRINSRICVWACFLLAVVLWGTKAIFQSLFGRWEHFVSSRLIHFMVETKV